MEKTIEKLKKQARDSWSGEEGEKRAEILEEYLRAKLGEYSKALDVPESEILKAWESKRDYIAINYYQECNQPSIDKASTRILDSVQDFLDSVGDKGFRCPHCNEKSNNPYTCDSGENVNGKQCDWTAFGLFGCLGKGTHIFIKDKLRGETLFMPIAWEEALQES